MSAIKRLMNKSKLETNRQVAKLLRLSMRWVVKHKDNKPLFVMWLGVEYAAKLGIRGVEKKFKEYEKDC